MYYQKQYSNKRHQLNIPKLNGCVYYVSRAFSCMHYNHALKDFTEQTSVTLLNTLQRELESRLFCQCWNVSRNVVQITSGHVTSSVPTVFVKYNESLAGLTSYRWQKKVWHRDGLLCYRCTLWPNTWKYEHCLWHWSVFKWRRSMLMMWSSWVRFTLGTHPVNTVHQ